MKNFFIDLYFEKGKQIGKYLLINLVIAATAIIIMNVLVGVDVTFAGVMEWAISLPVFAIVVGIVRLVLSLFHKIIPMRAGIVKFIIDFIIFVVIIALIGFVLGDANLPESEILGTILMIIINLIYISLTIFLLLADILKQKFYNEQE